MRTSPSAWKSSSKEPSRSDSESAPRGAEGASVSHQALTDLFPAVHWAGRKCLICCLREASSWAHYTGFGWVPVISLEDLRVAFSEWNVYRNQAENKVRQEPSRGVVLLLNIFFFWIMVNLQCCVSFRCTVQWFSYTHTHICYFFKFFSIIAYYRILSRVPCIIHRVLVGYLFHI